MSPTTSAFSSRADRTSRYTRGLRRWLFLIHRWLGVALALLMALWAVSGFVIMYVSYPETTAEERLAGLDPLDLTACCEGRPPPAGPIEGATVEMLGGQPVLRWIGPDGPALAALAGQAPAIGQREAGAIAQVHLRNALGSAGTVRVEPIEVDQWTLQQQRYAPLYKASFADARGTVLYVSGLTGEVVQDTHARERFWNWLGAVPHWLYFTLLRQNGPLWSQVVIYTSLLGVFLTVTGIYVGIVMYGRGKRRSPFRGAALWHHWTGLLFGVATLTWVASGLFSMNPWGWFESRGPTEEIPNLAGRQIEGADISALVEALAAHSPGGMVAAEIAVQRGKPYAILVRADGSRTRAALPSLAPAPPSVAEFAAIARIAKPTTPIASALTITAPDDYHYGHKSDDPVLPAYRVIYANDDETRLYFDPATAELVNFVDADVRAFRWWHLGIHRLDFPIIRSRPLWDLVTVPLLAGVFLLCLLGLWMAVRRLRRPVGPIRRGR